MHASGSPVSPAPPPTARAHLAAAGCSVLGDVLYGGRPDPRGLALRAVELAYRDPFTHRPVRIQAPAAEFLQRFGLAGDLEKPNPCPPPRAS